MDALDRIPPLDWTPPAVLAAPRRHAPALRWAIRESAAIWRWLPCGPFGSDEAHAAHLAAQAERTAGAVRGPGRPPGGQTT